MSKSMTPKRAIEILKNLTYVKVLENNAHSNGVIHSESACKKDNEDLAAIQMAIKALEYRIPKKPLAPISKLLEMGRCPNCNAALFDKNLKFCGDCGQALDWSDEECANG